MPNNKTAITFLHFHKAAGTSICNNFIENYSLSSYQIYHNCNLQSDGPHNSLELNYHGKTCKTRENEINEIYNNTKQQVKFFGIERFMDPIGMELCKSYFYITIIRHPYSRIVSHHNYELLEMNGHVLSVKEGLSYDLRKDFKGKKFTYDQIHLARWSYSTISNYYIRMLLGYDIYFEPDINKINKEHLKKAKKILDKFDLVIILERLNESVHIFKQLFGIIINKRPRNKLKHDEFADYFTTEEVELLKDANKYDMKLYKYVNNTIYENVLIKYPENNNNNDNNNIINNDKKEPLILKLMKEKNQKYIGFLQMPYTFSKLCRSINSDIIPTMFKSSACTLKYDKTTIIPNEISNYKNYTCEIRNNDIHRISKKLYTNDYDDEKNYIKFYKIGKFMNMGNLCSDHYYITILRHPLERIASLWSKYHKFRKNIPDNIEFYINSFIYNETNTFDINQNIFYQNLNNYYIRTILGYDTFITEKITFDHYQLAQQKLKQFDMILIYEYLEEMYFILKELLNIQIKSPFDLIFNDLYHENYQYEIKGKKNQSILKKNNEYDIKLYDYAKIHIYEKIIRKQFNYDHLPQVTYPQI